MVSKLTRRDFVRTSALAAGAAALSLNIDSLQASPADGEQPFQTKLHCAQIVGAITPERIEELAKLGYEGVETTLWDIEPAKAIEARKICESFGMKIHSVMRAWTNVNVEDQAAADVDSMIRALRAASAYGASAILLVPCRTGVKSPAPWDFKIDYDPETCEVKSVCEGDNAPYADYIKAQNEATIASVKYVKEAIPVAAYEGVTIGLENVWNNLWCTPEFFGAFIRSFDNVWVKAYFDLGNHVKYAKTEDWLRALKGITCKLHIKDFLFDKSKPNGGDFVPIGKGSVDWKSVRNVIEEVEYNGFVTVESGGFSDAEHAKIFENFFAGKDILEGV